MRQQDAYKLLAAFMILIMIIVPVAYVVTSPRSEEEQKKETESQQIKYNQEYWTVNQPFSSISNALNMTPPGAESAVYADLDGMTPLMAQAIRQIEPVIDEADTIYKSNTTKLYYARMRNNSFLLLSTMSPEKNDFQYIELPQLYGEHHILLRQEQGLNGLYNVMGTPVILAPADTMVGTLDIITSLNKTKTAYDQYHGLLSKVEPAPYQKVSSNVSFAKQFYMGIGQTNGSYERTAVYLNANSSTQKKLNQLKANSTQKGFSEYNIIRSGDYTTVRIVTKDTDLFKVLDEEIS